MQFDDITLISYLFPIVGFICLLVSLFQWFNIISFQKNSLTAKGTVIKLIERPSEDTILYAPVFTFSDEMGKEYTVNFNTASYPPQYQVNQEVEVLYNSVNPENALIKNNSNMFFVPILTLVIAIMFIVFGFIVNFGLIG